MIAFNKYIPERRRHSHQQKLTYSQKKFATLLRYGFTCCYCGLDLLASPENFALASVDHFHPRSAGGGNTPDNRLAACQICNTLKAADIFSTIDEARAAIAERREKLADDYSRFLFRFPTVGKDGEIDASEALNIVRVIFDQEEVPA